MIELTAGSMADALLSCYNHFNRNIGIAFSSHTRMRDFAMSLQKQHREGLVPKSHYKTGIDEIFFDTGSCIRMFDASDPRNVYGRRFDSVLYDPEIQEEDIKIHLESCEKKWKYVRFKNREDIRVDPDEWDMEIDNQPLDDFLSKFNIVS